jgi:subtilisin
MLRRRFAMRVRIPKSILVGLLAICVLSVGLAIAATGNGAGLDRVPVLIGFKQVPGPSERALVRSNGGVIKYSYTLVPAIAASIPEPAIEGLAHNPNVTVVEPDVEVHAIDEELDRSWGVKRIGAGTVHAAGNGGAEVKVAIIDTGIDYSHPDLDGNYQGGKDFVNNDTDPMDDNGHGTHCAGIVAAEDDGSGVVGVAPQANLYALKVLDSGGSGYFSDVIAALQWAVDNDIEVTSNSYGSSRDPGSLVQAAFDNAASAGIVNVCAAGNSGRRNGTGDTVEYPAKYASCIAVAATDSGDSRAYFSSTGPEVELAAPGVYIYSTYLGGYATLSGTSMACPHVAGTAALVIAAGIGDVRTQLQQTADDLGAAGRDPLYGYGLVNAAAAVGTSTLPPADTIPPAAPTGLTASAGDGMVSLDWKDNTESDLAGYNVYRSTSSGGSYSEIATLVTANHYEDTAVSNGTTYYYVVTASDASFNESSTSSEAFATPQASGGGGGTMHVSAIDMTSTAAGPNYFVYTTVTIVDESGSPVPSATVDLTMTLPDGSASGYGTTSTDGTVTFKLKSRQTGTYTSEVTNVTHATLTYDSSANVETKDSLPVP